MIAMKANKFGPGSFCSNAPGDICGVATAQMMDISPREVQGAKHTVGLNDDHSSSNRSLDDRGQEPARRRFTTILESEKNPEETRRTIGKNFCLALMMNSIWDFSNENSNSENPRPIPRLWGLIFVHVKTLQKWFASTFLLWSFNVSCHSNHLIFWPPDLEGFLGKIATELNNCNWIAVFRGFKLMEKIHVATAGLQ